MPQIWIQKSYFQSNGLGWFHICNEIYNGIELSILWNEVEISVDWILLVLCVWAWYSMLDAWWMCAVCIWYCLLAKEENKWVHSADGFGPVCIIQQSYLTFCTNNVQLYTKPHSIFQFNLGRWRCCLPFSILYYIQFDIWKWHDFRHGKSVILV